jgi:hypothetical protein
MKTDSSNQKAAVLLLLAALSAVLFSCHLLFPYKDGKELNCDYYDGKTPVELRKVDNYNLTVTVLSKPTVPPQITSKDYRVNRSHHSTAPGAGLRPSKKAYSDQDNWTIWYVPAKFLGAAYIVTRDDDRDVRMEKFLEFDYTDDVSGLYIAYDSKIKPDELPPWIKDYYNPLPEENHLLVKKDDGTIKLRIYKHKNTPPKNTVISFRSNLSGYASLPPGVLPDEIAMYIPIIKPREKAGSGVSHPYDDFQYSACYPSREVALKTERQKVITSLEENNHFTMEMFDIQKTECEINTLKGRCECPAIGSTTGTLSTPPKEYSHLADIEINHSLSRATLTVEKNTYTTYLNGNIRFKYLIDEDQILTEMYIMKMEIYPDNMLNTKLGNITDMSITLTEPAIAFQNDPSPYPTPRVPCEEYVIPTDQLECTALMTVDGDREIIDTKNSEPVKIQVDNTARTISFDGTLRTKIIANDNDVIVTIQVDITGDFLNFPPTAKGDLESTPYVECLDGLNSGPIILDASGSFDVYDTLKDKIHYQWFKDYRTPLEIAYKKGIRVTIPAATLNVGIHQFTVVVTDDYGLVDSDIIQVEVRDETPPNLTAPSDRIRVVSPPATCPAAVPDLGNALYDDGCAGGDVRVTNDAPENRMFPEGETDVTWKAYDGHGNMTAKVQKVTVIQLINPRGALSVISSSLYQSMEKISGSLEAEGELREAVNVNIEPLVQDMEAAVHAVETAEWDGREKAGSHALEHLIESFNQLRDFSFLIRIANEAEGANRAPILNEARKKLGEAKALLRGMDIRSEKEQKDG